MTGEKRLGVELVEMERGISRKGKGENETNMKGEMGSRG